MTQPWLKNYDKGVPASLKPYPDVPLFHFLEEAARKYPNQACTIFKGATITYAQMNEITDRVAAGLAKIGLQKGDRVGIFMPNMPQFVMAYYGILKAGGVVVAVNPTYPAAELVKPLKDSDIRVLFCMSRFYNTVNEAREKAPGLKTVIVANVKEALPPLTSLIYGLFMEKKGGDAVTLRPGDYAMPAFIAANPPSARPRVSISGDDPAMFQYSGGTTGDPKAAVALHRNLVANCTQIRGWEAGYREGQEPLLLAIPLYHVYGMVAGMALSVAGCSPMILVIDARVLDDVLDNIKKHKPTHFPGVPRLFAAISNHPKVKAREVDLSSIKVCISGSAPLLLEIKQKFEKLSGAVVFEGYGLSECPTASHCNPIAGQNKEGSVGMPLPDTDVKIIDLDDGRTELGVDQVGEIVVRAPQVMWGYHNMTEQTAVMLRDLGDGGGPWLFTGDIGRMDSDGYFYIVDRKKELIKVGGFQVWPRDIEEALTAHPKVLEAAAAGVPHPEYGETAKAWVVLRPGETATVQELKEWCGERLAKYKVPHEIEFRPELPKTAVFKVLRRELVRQHKDAMRK